MATSAGSLPNASDQYARVMTFNTKEGEADAVQIVETVKAEHVEVLAMQEVTWDLINRLKTAGIASYLPYSNIVQQTWHDNGESYVLMGDFNSTWDHASFPICWVAVLWIPASGPARAPT